ncbi:MAG: hypothetical protein P8R54_25035 [Myxococcota bacterium]|nr:hypothetical protein [Myxococcota bacterium]
MVVISGTGRSGTSMWMQILADAGMSVLGERFPSNWEKTLKAANPQGFFESTLVKGINFTTNPDPISGARVIPEESREQVVKIFASGVRRTERIYLDRVLLTVRHWRAFALSVHRLNAIQSAQNIALPETQANPCVWWFLENIAVLQDAMIRGYPMRAVTYEAVLAEPEAVVGEILGWLGVSVSAAHVVDPSLRTVSAPSPIADEGELPSHWLEGFDALHAAIEDGSVWTPGRIQGFMRLREELHSSLQPRGLP